MLCLHGKPAVLSTTENGTLWTCGEPSTCFRCSRGQKKSYDKAIKAFLATKQDRPVCCGIVPADKARTINRYWANYHKYRTYTETSDGYNPFKSLGRYISAADVEQRYARFGVYTGKEWEDDFKEGNIGRPFFMCGNSTDRNPWGCGYFEWGDKNIVTKPICHHGMTCKVVGTPGRGSFFCVQRRLMTATTSRGQTLAKSPPQKRRKLKKLSRPSKERTCGLTIK